MSQLDEVSKAIGSLQAQVDHIAAVQQQRAEKDERFRHSALDKLNSVEFLALRITETKKDLDESIERLEHVERTIASARNKIIGGVFALSMAGSAMGAKLLAFLGVK